ncbi:MAG: hypothetical protein ABSG44_07280 [Thermodesulfobacteriota bacterium]|jgi:hypothetical protein
MKKFEIATLRSQRLRRIATGYALAMTALLALKGFFPVVANEALHRMVFRAE